MKKKKINMKGLQKMTDQDEDEDQDEVRKMKMTI